MELRRSHSRRAEEHKSSKAVSKGKHHDWGIAQRKKAEPSAPSKEGQTHSVSASEVPEALRARIKTMLSQT